MRFVKKTFISLLASINIFNGKVKSPKYYSSEKCFKWAYIGFSHDIITSFNS